VTYACRFASASNVVGGGGHDSPSTNELETAAVLSEEFASTGAGVGLPTISEIIPGQVHRSGC
jgi:hypothetical protein